MLSRIAESLYWIGRYVERAEDTARITEVTYSHSLGLGSSGEGDVRRRRHWEALIAIVGDRARFEEDVEAPADEESVPPYLTFGRDNPNSIISCIGLARENARTMRHQIASEMWEVLNRFHLELQRVSSRSTGPVGAENAYLFYRSVMDFSHLFQGITDSTMPREEGWYFLQAGKFLERAEKTARALDVQYRLLAPDRATQAVAAGRDEGAAGHEDRGDQAGGAGDAWPGESDATRANGRGPHGRGDPRGESHVDGHAWITLLRSLSSYEAYFRISSTGIRPAAVVEMLALSPVVPRSIRFAIGKVDTALAHITDDAIAYNGSELLGPSAPSEARRAAGRLHSALAYQRIGEVFERGVHDYLLDLQRQCYAIGELIEEEFFAHRPLTAQDVL